MGRRPNAVVSEWFYRGAKIEDASNRYAHTCRRCGELFAKGRVEYLMQHLLKKCPNISDADRAVIAQQLQKPPIPRPFKKAPPHTRNDYLATYSSVNTGLPSTLDRQQSALDTLAEVSRHHLDYSVHRHPSLIDSHINVSDQDLAEQVLWAQLQQQALGYVPTSNTHDYEMTNNVHANAQDNPRTQEPPAGSIVQHDSQRDFLHDQLSSAPPLTQLDPQLDPETTARLASQLAAASYDPAEHSVYVPDTAHEPPADPANSHVDSIGTDFVPYAPELGKSQSAKDTTLNHLRSKARSKFTESRRREVREIRKRGACIRCRMLKKPCSEGTPCRTCANVDVARLWKGKCLRTKLSDEFSAWTLQFFANLWSRYNSSHPVEEVSVSAIDLEISVSQLDHDGVQRLRLPITAQHRHSFADGDASTPIITITDMDDSIARLASYCATGPALDLHIDNESNPLIRTTLQEAQAMCGEEEWFISRSTDRHSTLRSSGHASSDTRTCYNVATQLLSHVLELWALTVLLTSWQTSSDTGDPKLSFQLASKPSTTAPEETMAALTIANHSRIRLQLFVMLEKKASVLGKAVLTDLERHLLQRQQVSSYATFLAAVVLLSCVERMTDFYHGYELNDCSDLQSLQQRQHASSEAQFEWPLAVPPIQVWSQGPSFAQLLETLLIMRGLPPHVYENEDEGGRLAVREENLSNVSKINGSTSEAQLRAHEEERHQALAAWLQKCNVRASDIKTWLEQDDGWHGKFVAGTLIMDQPAVQETSSSR